MNLIPVTHLDDPRLIDYADVRERQLSAVFSPAAPGVGAAGDPDAPWGKFMAEGEVVFPLLLASPYRTLSMLCTPTRLETIRPHLTRLPEGTPVYVLPQQDMNRLVGFPLHRGLMAIGARNAPAPLSSLLAGGARLILILEDLTNHDNVGAAFRNAAAFGVGAVLLSPRCADPLYRKAIRVSVGHALRIPFGVLAPWPAALDQVKAAGFQVIGLSPNPPAHDLRQLPINPIKDRIACLIGSEGPGLSREALSSADALARIQMAPGVDSLNVAVSAGIALEHLHWRLTSDSSSAT